MVEKVIAVVEEAAAEVKKPESVIEAFELGDKLPDGVKGDIRVIESKANGHICDGDIHTIYSMAYLGFQIAGKMPPTKFTFTEVRGFYHK